MRVAVCQLNSRGDRAANLAAAQALLTEAAAAGAVLAVLPEYTDYLGPKPPAPEPVDGQFGTHFAAAARELGIWVLAGSFRELPRQDLGGRAYNTSLLFDNQGRLVNLYRKIHLFDVDIPGGVRVCESDVLAPGDEPVVATVAGVPVGLSICYDLRFPELYRSLAASGAQVLAVPAAFTAHTGRDHWEVLLRARAIENQCYVVAAAQIGDHEQGFRCYGRSMVVDPWGTVVAQLPDHTGIAVADLDLDRLRTIRTELPSLANRRL